MPYPLTVPRFCPRAGTRTCRRARFALPWLPCCVLLCQGCDAEDVGVMLSKTDRPSVDSTTATGSTVHSDPYTGRRYILQCQVDVQAP